MKGSIMNMLDDLQVRRDGITATLEGVVQAAENDKRDLTEEELSERSSAMKDIAAIDLRMESLAGDLAMNMELAEKVRNVGKLQSAPPLQYRSAGAMLWDQLHQSEDPSAKQRLHTAMRAAEHMGTLASATTPTAGDLGGLVVSPSRGAIVDPYPSGMPFVSYLGLQTAQDASFSRPQIVDPNFETAAGVQTLEKAEVLSKKFDVTAMNLSPVTIATYLNISAQLLLLQAGSWDIIIRHLRKRVSYAIEANAIAEVAKTTGKQELAVAATAAGLQTAVYAAAGQVLTITGEPATFILMGATGFARIGGVADLAGRPMFPNLSPANAPGTSTANAFTSTVYGLHPVVSPAIKDGAIFVGNGASLEAWHLALPLMEVVEPSVLGKQVSVGSLFVPFRPTPFANAIISLKHTA